VSRWLGWLERRRAALVLGHPIPAVYKPATGGFFALLKALFSDPSTWKVRPPRWTMRKASPSRALPLRLRYSPLPAAERDAAVVLRSAVVALRAAWIEMTSLITRGDRQHGYPP
jgi:hypothetical protein